MDISCAICKFEDQTDSRVPADRHPPRKREYAQESVIAHPDLRPGPRESIRADDRGTMKNRSPRHVIVSISRSLGCDTVYLHTSLDSVPCALQASPTFPAIRERDGGKTLQ